MYLSYLEVYNEQIRDLLRPSPGIHLDLREDKDHVHVAGLSEIRATSTHEVNLTIYKMNIEYVENDDRMVNVYL